MNIFSNQSVVRDYDRYYETEQGKAVDRIERALIQAQLEQIPDTEMLELGCGTGHWTGYFCARGFRVTAIDESDAMLERAGTKNIAGAVFLNADAANLPFPDHRFSVIASVTMFEFVDDVDRVFDEIERVLKPGGYFIAGWLNALSAMGMNKGQSDVFRNARFYTPEEISRMLERFGDPQLSPGVYYSSGFELLDGTEKQHAVQPAFIASFVQKKA
ncbi:MAG: class I SAM-dependent methyltransferase [Prolixibacteraceae bacterium]